MLTLAAIGPLPVGLIAEAFNPRLLGYRETFLSSGLLMILVGFYAYLLVKEKADKRSETLPPHRRVYGIITIGGNVIFQWGVAEPKMENA